MHGAVLATELVHSEIVEKSKLARTIKWTSPLFRIPLLKISFAPNLRDGFVTNSDAAKRSLVLLSRVTKGAEINTESEPQGSSMQSIAL